MVVRTNDALNLLAWATSPWATKTLALSLLFLAPSLASAQEDHSGLTRESFRRNCLMCHSSAAPEGISAEIMEGLHPAPGLRPREALPGLVCWRRCEACKLPDRAEGEAAPAR